MFSEIRNPKGEKIDFTFHEGNPNKTQIVVIGHGVTGNKDRPFVVALAEKLASEGINALRFSFAGNGDSEGQFTDCHISKEVEDLGAVLDQLDGYDVCYVGHSMGGAVGVLRTSHDKRIHYLVSLAGMVHTKKFAETEFGMETPDEGFMWEDEDCPLSKAYMDDLTNIGTVLEDATNVVTPWLLVHGTEDDVVPPQESKEIIEKAGGKARLEIIDGANHVFAEPHTAAMTELVTKFVKEQFNK